MSSRVRRAVAIVFAFAACSELSHSSRSVSPLILQWNKAQSSEKDKNPLWRASSLALLFIFSFLGPAGLGISLRHTEGELFSELVMYLIAFYCIAICAIMFVSYAQVDLLYGGKPREASTGLGGKKDKGNGMGLSAISDPPTLPLLVSFYSRLRSIPFQTHPRR
jgi:hypothetical protein